MNTSSSYDAIVVGSGPNGLAAAIVLAQAGLSVAIFEAKKTIGGGMRSAELTLPGFIHDICSAIHPLGIGSPFFKSLPLDQFQLEWVHPLTPLAHPFDDGSASVLERSIEATGATLGIDNTAYIELMKPLVASWDKLANDVLGPLHLPKHPLILTRFGFLAIRSAKGLSESLFKGPQAKGLFSGLAAHSIMPLDWHLTAAFGLILGILGHACGWPMAKGGSQKIADALGSFFLSLGGKIFTDTTVSTIDELPPSRIVLCDVGPQQLLQMAGHHFPSSYRRQLENYRYGPGVFKVDWALNHPIPWKNKECARAGTVHLSGTAEEIEVSERAVWQGEHSTKPYVILAQQSLFDPERAPPGKHTAWGYCHVPNGSSIDMTQLIEAQVERFAPGFADCILARSTRSAVQIQEYNANYVGGDINGGVQDIYQLFIRPAARLIPYSTPLKGLYLCSSSTPPGGGVHGMCGFHAAHAALKKFF